MIVRVIGLWLDYTEHAMSDRWEGVGEGEGLRYIMRRMHVAYR